MRNRVSDRMRSYHDSDILSYDQRFIIASQVRKSPLVLLLFLVSFSPVLLISYHVIDTFSQQVTVRAP